MINKHSVKNSFRLVKTDILKIEGEMMNIKAQQVRILEQLEKLTSKISNKKPVKKKVSRKK